MMHNVMRNINIGYYKSIVFFPTLPTPLFEKWEKM